MNLQKEATTWLPSFFATRNIMFNQELRDYNSSKLFGHSTISHGTFVKSIYKIINNA